MLKTELLELIRNGENSGVEFKRDDVHPDSLAKEIVALLNFEGGHVLLGVEDDGAVTGLTRAPKQAEEWLMTVCRDHVRPPIIPYWETIPVEESKIVGVVTLPSDSPDKPFKAKRGSAWVTLVRQGTTSIEASREQEARLYQASGMLRYDVRPAIGSTLADLDLRRLRNYFRDVRQQDCPAEDDKERWTRLLVNTDLMAEERGISVPTTGALLLFGVRPNRFLPQAGITAAAYAGLEKDYAAVERSVLRAPLVSLLGESGEVLENGLIELTMEFVRRNSSVEAWVDEGGRLQSRWKDYPLEAVREAIINAVAHRDYTITGIDIELSIYRDRLEVISPGRLPNTVTVEKMKEGYRASRNELIKEVLRDYRYVEATGLGVPRKIIRGMRQHNGTEPDLVEADERFTVRLRKALEP
jgi:ATP-dependent DNA helicase RecG